MIEELTGVSVDHDRMFTVVVVVDKTWSRLSMHDRDVANRTFPGFLQAWPLTVLATSDQPTLVLSKATGKEAALLLP